MTTTATNKKAAAMIDRCKARAGIIAIATVSAFIIGLMVTMDTGTGPTIHRRRLSMLRLPLRASESFFRPFLFHKMMSSPLLTRPPKGGARSHEGGERETAADRDDK